MGAFERSLQGALNAFQHALALCSGGIAWNIVGLHAAIYPGCMLVLVGSVQRGLVLVDEKRFDAFRLNHVHDFVESRFVRVELLIPHGRSAFLIFHLQRPIAFMLKPVDVDADG